jgi:uncharacterized sulfatase
LWPTLVDVAGGDWSADEAAIDGVSVCRSWQETDWNPDRSLVWHFPYYHPERGFADAPTRIGVDDFVASQTRPQSAIRRGSYKLIQFAEDDRVELYELSTDVSEQNDLSAIRPEVAEKLQGELNRRLDSMNARRAVPR